MPFNNIEYWRGRMREKLKSNFGQVMMNIRELEDTARHINLDMGKIDKAITTLIKSYRSLDDAFGVAEVKKK
jgi:sugar diacid utilization regulator